MNASLQVSPMCRRCGDPVDPDAEICPSCGAIASPTAVRTSAYSVMSGTTKGVIIGAVVCVLGLAAYTLMPGSMRGRPPVEPAVSDATRSVEADRSRARAAISNSRGDASEAAALDAVRDSIQRHDIESAKILLTAILALHQDNQEALALRQELNASDDQQKPAAPVAAAKPTTPPPKVAETQWASNTEAATSRHHDARTRAHERATRSAEKTQLSAKAQVKLQPHGAAIAKTGGTAASQKSHVVVREAQVKQVTTDTSRSSAVQTASGAPLVTNGTQKAPSSDQNGAGDVSGSQRWRDRGGMR